MTAEAKKPWLIAASAERSPSLGVTARMPITTVTAPIMGISSGKTRPAVPKAASPRTGEATRVTAQDSSRSAAIPAQSPTLSASA